MEFLWWFCKGTGIMALAVLFLAILYAILSTLIENIVRDVTNMRDYVKLKHENQELLEKIQRLELELVDKELAKEYNDDKRTKIEF